MADRPKKPDTKQPEAKKPDPRQPEAKKPEKKAETKREATKPIEVRIAGEGLARPDPDGLFPRTEAQWAVYVDDVVDGANRGLKRASVETEAVAEGLFRATFVRDVEAGLQPAKNPTEAFQRIGERAGASLNLTFAEFVNYIRVGAMNQHRDDSGWDDLHWSKKLILVEALDLPDGMDKLKQGIQEALQPNVGVRHLREWLYRLKPKKPGSAGRPRNDGSLSLTSGGRFAETGVQLRSERQRKAFVKRLANAPPKKRRKLVKDLRDALEGLQALVEEIEGLDD